MDNLLPYHVRNIDVILTAFNATNCSGGKKYISRKVFLTKVITEHEP
jgi:hypothetical protein